MEKEGEQGNNVETTKIKDQMGEYHLSFLRMGKTTKEDYEGNMLTL